jgi:uncharacterized membrane protein
LDKPWANTLTAVYLLQPVVFNVNLFDFHPEVIAIPCLLAAVWAARAGNLLGFTIAIVITLGCRDSLALNITVMGIWLMIFENRRGAGAIALGLGLIWFYLATQWVIPSFRSGGVESIARYAEFGDSIPAILASLVLRPQLLISRLATGDNLFYLALLFIPWVWGLKLGRSLLPLLPALPNLAMNLLTTYYPQKDLVHQYSLPIIPFLWLAALCAVSSQNGSKTPWWRTQRPILIWSTIGFLCLAKYSYIGGKYLANLDTWQASTRAIAQIPAQASVLATAKLAPHLAHRSQLKITIPEQTVQSQMANSDYILLDRRHPGNAQKTQNLDAIIAAAQGDPHRQLITQQQDIYLFGPR